MIFNPEEISILENTADELGVSSAFKAFDWNFTISEENDPLFGEEKEANLRTEYFAYLWKVVEYRLRETPGRESFLPGSLSGLKEAFYETLSGLWYDPAKETAEILCGTMPFPYREWLEKKVLPLIMSGRHFHDMALAYPVLGVQAAIVTSAYALHIAEVMEAVSSLPRLFKVRGKVSDVSASESDWHDHSRSVHIITFSHGDKLVYKPHSMAVDRGFALWLDALCDRNKMEHFPLAKSRDCGKGSFCEFVQHNPLNSRKDAALFFYRCGFLMAAVYSLGGSDMHAENIIANGAFPLPVDLETVILTPDCILSRINNGSKTPGIESSGFLPALNIPPGLNPSGTDSLTSVFNSSSNLPYFEDETFRGSDYIDDICRGFSACFDILHLHREEMKDVFIKAFEGVEIRLVLRATSGYFRLLNFLEMPANIKNAQTYNKVSGRIDYNSSNLSREENARISETERTALLRLDIPKFNETLNKDSLDGLYRKLTDPDPSFVKNQSDMIRFTLTCIKADDDTDKPFLAGSGKNNIPNMAESFMNYLEGGIIPVVEAAKERRFYPGSRLGSAPYLLEGGLGIFIALGAYARAYNEKKVTEFLKGKAPVFTEIRNLGNALSKRATGISDGLGGLIRGLCIGLEMDLFSSEDVKPVFEAVIRDVIKPGDIPYLPCDFLHGSAGLLYAMERMPSEFKSGAYNDIILSLRDNLREKAVTDLPLKAEEISTNHTLMYGNAGLLYRSGDHRLARILEGVTSPIEGISAPGGYLYTGLFSGMSGILYSLSRYSSSDKVPEI